MTNIKSQKATMQPTNSSVDLYGLKMVKNATIFKEREVYFIRHYATIIFAYNQKSGLVEANFNCSMTSNRQINNAISFFGIDKKDVVDVSDGSKWAYSGELVQ